MFETNENIEFCTPEPHAQRENTRGTLHILSVQAVVTKCLSIIALIGVSFFFHRRSRC